MNITDLITNYKPDQTLRSPYIIAEAGVNHEGDLDLAKRLIDEAAEAGADAIKFQTYKASTLASKHSPAYWDTTKEPTKSQYELFKKYDRFWKNEFEILKTYCDDIGIEFLSTPFDAESAEFLDELMPAFKISSSDITNKPFIQLISSFGKPIILSTGASTLDEIKAAISWTDSCPLALLHCILNYPTPDEFANLGMISGLKMQFPEIPIGYSDHTLPKDMRSLEIATLLGSVILEKHFTHDKTLPGNDHYHAMDKEDLKIFRHNLARDLLLYGNTDKKPLPEEEPARQNARRSLVAARPIPKGQVINREDLTYKRPASGVSPALIDEVIGQQATSDIDEDDVIIREHLSGS